MNKILLLCLISLSLNANIGPAINPKYPDSTENCVTYFPYDGDYNKFCDDLVDQSEVPKSESDCVDLLLWDKYDQRYYDRCCFIRFQINGAMHTGWALLTEEQYLDITETKRRIENGDQLIIDRATVGSKVYQLDCNSNFIKAMSIAYFLFAFML